MIKDIYKRILELPSLDPSPKTNSVFRELVEFATDIRHESDLTSEEENRLCDFCADAEYKLELDFAVKLTKKEHVLEDFIYYNNYSKLVDLEYGNIQIFKKDIKKALFVGGGPLPLTAILLAIKTGMSVDILEKDEQAIKISKNTIANLNISNIKVIQGDAYEFSNYNEYELIVIASLLDGNSDSKIKLIDDVYESMQDNALLLIRSSHNNRCVLYKPIDIKKLRNLPLIEVRPHNEIINSFLVFEK